MPTLKSKMKGLYLSKNFEESLIKHSLKFKPKDKWILIPENKNNVWEKAGKVTEKEGVLQFKKK